MMFEDLEAINVRPAVFSVYSAEALWTDEHTSRQMLAYHLDPAVDVSSRRHAFIDRSVDWMVSHFDLGPGKAVADFGCGPGLYTSRLARSGADVTGIDFSQRSIQYATKTAAENNLDVTYIQQNYLEYETHKRFDLILLIMCDFCALSPAQRQTLLSTFHTLLQPGGRVLLDVYTLNAFAAQQETAVYGKNLLDGFWSAQDYYAFLNTFKYSTEQVTLDKYTIVEADRTRVVYNWLQYFSPESLRAQLQAAGFAVDQWLGSVAGDAFDPAAGEMAVIASRS